MRLFTLSFPIALLTLPFAWQESALSSGPDEGISAEQIQFFESKVRPLFIEHCVRCHGEEKQEGGLRLDSRSAFGLGGENGAVVDRETPDESLLLSAIHYKDLEMPPSGKLPEHKLEVLERWIQEGSVWPLESDAMTPRTAGKGFTAEDRSYWFFQPLTEPSPLAGSAVSSATSVSSNIDSMVEQRLGANGLRLAEPASSIALVRRLYLDLVGVQPTPAEAKAFLNAPNGTAYEQLVDRLLDDPRYGQRWGKFWLDLVRFAESDGYKQDDFRPTAYRYRDYVIRAFNEDKPYGDFVREQLSGDELDPHSLECRDASGFLRLWIYEYNQRDVEGQWTAILNDLTDVTGEAFMGLGFGCARCHDHKFDPLLQKDYFRLQAYFSGIIPREDLPAATLEQIHRQANEEETWREAAGPFLDTIDRIEGPHREKTIQSAIAKFPPDVRPAIAKPDLERSTREKQLAHLAALQQQRDVREIKWEKVLSVAQREEWRLAKEYLKQLPASKPDPLPASLAATDTGRIAAEVYIPGKSAIGAIQPGVPSILDPNPMEIPSVLDRDTTGRRSALAEWLVRPDNPFTWRVIVNRIWQQHFGQGIVVNASDFGRLTEAPSHPELLDFLAKRFVEGGGRFKALHRWILLSQTYRQAAYPASMQESQAIDPNNRWLWRFSPRRLDAEQIRDSILVVSGEIIPMREGQSVDGKRPARSIFVRSMRNSQDRFLALFDSPDGSTSSAKRNATTTPLQSLMMMNSDWVNKRASEMAAQILSLRETPETAVAEAFERVWLRPPTSAEMVTSKNFLRLEDATDAQAWPNRFVDYCHVLINSNSFLYME